jgi:hypothetical protein
LRALSLTPGYPRKVVIVPGLRVCRNATRSETTQREVNLRTRRKHDACAKSFRQRSLTRLPVRSCRRSVPATVQQCYTKRNEVQQSQASHQVLFEVKQSFTPSDVPSAACHLAKCDTGAVAVPRSCQATLATLAQRKAKRYNARRREAPRKAKSLLRNHHPFRPCVYVPFSPVCQSPSIL